MSVAERAFQDAIEELHSLKLSEPKIGPPLILESFAPSGLKLDSQGEKNAHTTAVLPLPATHRKIPSLSKAPTLSEALQLLKSGKISSVELVQESLRVASETVRLGTVVSIDEESVLAQARTMDGQRDRGESLGPLHGIPITVKDIIDVAGMPTRAGSKAYYDLPSIDAKSVALLKRAGGLILAKVATHEFALGVTTPQCRNPYDDTRISGGSSGGSAIAVATGVGLASLGTDTRASLRVPSSLCGVVGFKPSFGRVSTHGIVPLSWTIDHIGPITRTVQDAGIMMNVISQINLYESKVATVDLANTNIGVLSSAIDSSDGGIAKVINSVLPVFSMLGASVKEVGTPSASDFALSNSLGLLISRCEAATVHRSLGTDLDLTIPEVHDQLLAALDLKAVDYLDAQRFRRELAQKILPIFDQFEVLVMPTIPVEAPKWADYEKHLLNLSRYAIIWSLLGCPAASIPVGFTESKMPVGLQMVSAPGNESALFRIGMALEQSLSG